MTDEVVVKVDWSLLGGELMVEVFRLEVTNFASHQSLESGEEKEAVARRHTVRIGAAILSLRELVDGSLAADTRKAQNQFLVRGGAQTMYDKGVTIGPVDDRRRERDESKVDKVRIDKLDEKPQVYLTLQLVLPEPLSS